MPGSPLHILEKYWGYSRFREPQDQIVDAVLRGEDTLALLPTGGGKSICFQVPGMLKNGITVVVSPLISLMKDQVANLQKRGIKAVALYTGMPSFVVVYTWSGAMPRAARTRSEAWMYFAHASSP